MVTKSILKLGLADAKGTDFSKIKEKRRLKAIRKEKAKKKAQKPAEPEEEESEDEQEEDEDEIEDEGNDSEDGDDLSGLLDIEAVDDSDSSDSEVEMEERIPRPPKKKYVATVQPTVAEDDDEDDDDEDDEEDEEDIPVSDLEDLDDDEKEDLIPHTRLTINNTAALLAALNRIRIPTDSSAPFVSHQSVVSAAPTAEAIPNVSDDLQRELQFYKQSRDAVVKARILLRKEKVPFSRPNDVSLSRVPAPDPCPRPRPSWRRCATRGIRFMR